MIVSLSAETIMRIRFLLWAAHVLRVPIDVHQSFFTNGMSLSKSASFGE